MTYEVKKLRLFQPLFYSPDGDKCGDEMTRFTTRVNKRTMHPHTEDYLTEPVFCGSASANGTEQIPAGTYAFIQGTGCKQEEIIAAAEQLWLECVWEEYEPVNAIFYLRKLDHGDETIFQLFREIKAIP